jgi:Tfp pilus assembly pilus retraction ATPase PilT
LRPTGIPLIPSNLPKPKAYYHERVPFSRILRLLVFSVCYVGSVNGNTQVLPGMVERGRGTILFTGCSGSLNGIACLSELCKTLS